MLHSHHGQAAQIRSPTLGTGIAPCDDVKTASLLVIVLAGCGSDSTSCDVHWDSHCEHPIDRLVIPRLRDLGIEPRDAAPGEYCRRLSIDLLGRVPTDDELAACIALPDAAARVDATMANPLYERTM